MSVILEYIRAKKKAVIGFIILLLAVFGWVKYDGNSSSGGTSIYAISTADSVISTLDKMGQDEYLKIAIDKLAIFQSNQEIEQNDVKNQGVLLKTAINYYDSMCES